MLDHAHTRDLVEWPDAGRVAIVADLDVTTPEQPRLGDALGGERLLLLAERDAHRLDPVMPRGMHDERAPTAADVQESLALAKTQFATNQIELGFLRVVERVSRMLEIRARVDHAFVEPQTIEIVADVVVILDLSLIHISEPTRLLSISYAVFCLK